LGNTTTKTGLRIQTALDSQIYLTGIEVPDEVMNGLNLEKSEVKHCSTSGMAAMPERCRNLPFTACAFSLVRVHSIKKAEQNRRSVF
jgi:hypothetical protein